ncbi:glycosyltransferase [Candidatus Methylospira mobilis]|uniref:Glycosyltransferase n=1 Tax=Candidatus Methylospira mobilis TaxID=1808979 RepID=A0A5Q0BI69_9GAMM|nr:glycosyltransferase [Candidatus Methylospira mobilis]QFY41828.1 glycosyltransferase [Candidatus Methylospira mobilis]WNV06695.1 glycosyltransferase [Candidatus Methylospira mobilis]
MKISIITCTWNSESYLEQSIASVLAQDYPEIEYIFVDGGSTDGTLERIAAIPREVHVLHNIRGGVAHAMNEGGRVASGDVVAHLRYDHYYLAPDALSRVAGSFSDATGWAFGRIVYDIGGRQLADGVTALPYSRKGLLRENFIPHPAIFVRRDWMEQAGGFDESLKFAQGYDLWLKLALRGDPAVIDEPPLAALRVHEGGLPTSNRLAAMEEEYLVRRRYIGRSLIDRLEHWIRFKIRRRNLLDKLAKGFK